MDRHANTCPLTQEQIIEQSFIEHRIKILDIAAFLDRLDRSIERNAEDDFRVVSFRAALAALSGDAPGRVERTQMIFSDPTVELKPELDQKAAFGAYDSARTPANV